jgi:hypothetical protein
LKRTISKLLKAGDLFIFRIKKVTSWVGLYVAFTILSITAFFTHQRSGKHVSKKSHAKRILLTWLERLINKRIPDVLTNFRALFSSQREYKFTAKNE